MFVSYIAHVDARHCKSKPIWRQEFLHTGSKTESCDLISRSQFANCSQSPVRYNYEDIFTSEGVHLAQRNTCTANQSNKLCTTLL